VREKYVIHSKQTKKKTVKAKQKYTTNARWQQKKSKKKTLKTYWKK